MLDEHFLYTNQHSSLGEGGRGKGENDNYYCHYKSYEGGLKNEASVIGLTNFGED